MSRHLFFCLALAAVPLAPPAVFAETAPLPQPTLLSDVVLPSSLAIGGVAFGGISDLDYDPSTNHLIGISDDRAQNGPVRYYDFKLSTAKDRISQIDIEGMHEIRAPSGDAFPENGADPEGVSFTPDHDGIIWSSERNQNNVPSLYTSKLDGTGTRSIDLPAAYLPDADGTTGTRPNLGFEGLELSTDGKYLVAAMENALVQDGDIATLKDGSRSRIIMFDANTLKPVHEYEYMTDPIPAAPAKADGSADNGISAILPLSDGRIVVVERSWASGVGDNIRFYLTDISTATDFNGTQTIPSDAKPAKKTLWFTLSPNHNMGMNIDNIECISMGPVVDGKQTLLIASDNNFSRHQATHFTLFAVNTAGE